MRPCAYISGESIEYPCTYLRSSQRVTKQLVANARRLTCESYSPQKIRRHIVNTDSIKRLLALRKCTNLFDIPHNHCSIGLKFSETLNGASVFDLISSTVTPSACSISVSPSVKSTSKTACNRV